MEVVLTRNLRKSILQGNPWIYRQAIQEPRGVDRPQLVKVVDQKKVFVGWGLYSVDSPLAIRMISLDKKAPNKFFYTQAMRGAKDFRQFLNNSKTNCYRLFNGEGDGLPGLVCDVYNQVAVLQFDGSEPYEFWDQDLIANWILENTPVETVYLKPRHDMAVEPTSWGQELQGPIIEVVENNCKFLVDIVDGQKTGFFLDQRDNRQYLKQVSQDKTVLNLFSYTGGFSIYAGQGGAIQVCSVDIAPEAINAANKNWKLNGLSPESHIGVCADVFEYIHTSNQKYDIVICDPPSLAKSEKNKDQAIAKYVETFSAAAKKVNAGGRLMLSSCSSHISFEEFYEIMSSALSLSRKRGRVLRISGQGSDHPFPHACPHLRYLKFFDISVL